MSSAGYVLALAARRLRHRSAGAVVTVLGIALGTAVVAGVFVGTKVAQDRSTSQAVARLPAAVRSARAVWFGVPTGAEDGYARLDRLVRSETERLPLGRPVPIALFRESTIAGRFAGLAAVDGLRGHVVLRSGRLPRPCRPERCEVLRLRGKGAIPNAPGLRLVEVGTGSLVSRQLFGDFLAPTDNALADAEVAPALRNAAGYHRPPPGPLLVADGVDALTASPVLANSYRSYAWVWPLHVGKPRLWQIDSVVRQVDRSRAALSARSSSFTVTAPIEELRAAERDATTAGRRLLLVGGEAAALLFAFAVLAARSLRRDLAAARRRLSWHGARRWQLVLLAVVEGGGLALAGAVLGWVAGTIAGLIAASWAGAPVGAVLHETSLAPAGLALMVAVLAAAAGVVAAVVLSRDRDGGRLAPLDVAAVAALAAAGLALLGGATDTERLATDDGAAALLLLVPGLLAFAAGVAAARLFGPLARLAGRAVHGRIGLRLAAVSLGRGGGTASVTVGFLVLAFALALLAEGYRATLSRSEADAAAYRVPLDFVVREDLTRLVPVFGAAPLERFDALAPGVSALPVLRLQAGAGATERVSGVTVLGLPAEAVPALRGWRDDWADASRAQLAEELASTAPARLRGPVVGRELVIGTSSGVLSLRAILETVDGRFRPLALGETPARGSGTLRVLVPAQLRDARLVGIQLDPPRIIERGADAGTALRGRLHLSGLDFDRWVGEGGVTVTPTEGGAELAFAITPLEQARLRPRQPSDDGLPAVLATPDVAALVGGPGGTLPLQIAGERIPVRVAGVVQRFPGTSGHAVVGDVDALVSAINTGAPGGARTNEVWLSVPRAGVPAVEAALRRPPFRSLETVSRRGLEADARRDPLGHGTLLALAAAALIALLLAAIGLALAVLADLRDERGELIDLEAQGARPSMLRRVVRLRALAVALAGLVGGALAGALLAALVTRVVSVTARAAAPEPPLVTSFDARVVAIGVLAFLVVAGASVAVATRGAFRSSRGPARATELGT